MLQALNELGDVGVRVIKASKEATIDSLTQLQPVLTELANSGDAFVKAFHVFLTYPFVDEVVGRDPQVARNLHMGDYTNLSITLDIDLTQGTARRPGHPQPPVHRARARSHRPARCRRRASCARACIDAINACLAEPDPATQLRGPAELHDRGDLRPAADPGHLPRRRGGGGGLPTSLPTIPLPVTCQSGLGALGGLLRPGTGYESAVDPERGPTFGQLSEAYDPALVALLVPALVVPEAEGGRRMITRRTKVQLVIFVDHHAARRHVRRRALRPARPLHRRPTPTRSPPTSATPAARSPAARSPTAVSRSGEVDRLVLTDDGVDVDPQDRERPRRHPGRLHGAGRQRLRRR